MKFTSATLFLVISTTTIAGFPTASNAFLFPSAVPASRKENSILLHTSRAVPLSTTVHHDRQTERRNLPQQRSYRDYPTTTTTRLYSASSASFNNKNNDFENNSDSIERMVQNVTSAYLQSVREAVQYDDDSEELQIAQRQNKIRHRQGTYRVTLPFLAVKEPSSSTALGISLAQVESDRVISEVELDLDSMQIDYPEDLPSSSSSQRIRMDRNQVLGRLEPTFRGLVVSAVEPESPAWASGVRPGDVLQAVSATLGDALWPKSTLEGVRAALSSRRTMSSNVVLELKHMAEQVRNQYELTLPKPLGIEVQENEEGYVEVTGFNENASNLVRYAVRVGDRVIAIDAALGDRMWPVSTVEGVISACTSRLPGQPVKMKFERPLENMNMVAVPVTPRASTKVEIVESSAAIPSSVSNRELLSRCRDVLKKYSNANEGGFRGKYDVPAIVADKVVDALASASATLDSVTLSMIMSSYISCKKPNKAIEIFESATGFKGDGSTSPVTKFIEGSEKGRIVPSEAALNLYTGTALIQAHALRQDLDSTKRVMAAMEGRSGEEFSGQESAPWPWTGSFGSIRPDTNFYNAVLSAAEKCGERGLELAREIFETLSEPSSKTTSTSKDIFTFNTYISLLSQTGRGEEAFRVFDRLVRSGLKPDKYTYTALVRSCNEDDVQELLYDMQERSIKPDVVFYNTVMSTLCEKRRWTAATRLVTDMEARSISPNGVTYGLLMSSLLRASKPSACLALFESASASERSSSIIQNVYLYTTAITAASALGDHDRAMELLSRMSANGVKPNEKTLSAAMSACLKNRDADLAIKLFEKIRNPDSRSMQGGIRAFCLRGDSQAALQLLASSRMKGRDLMHLYQEIVGSSLAVKDYDGARRAFRDMMDKGFIPGRALLLTVIDRLGIADLKSLKPEESDAKFGFLLFILDSFRARNLPIDGRFYSSFLLFGKSQGGFCREIATFASEKRVDFQSGSSLLSNVEDVEPVRLVDWETFYAEFSKYQSEDASKVLPTLLVRISPKDFRMVLRAEKALTSNSKRTKTRRQTVEA